MRLIKKTIYIGLFLLLLLIPDAVSKTDQLISEYNFGLLSWELSSLLDEMLETNVKINENGCLDSGYRFDNFAKHDEGNAIQRSDYFQAVVKKSLYENGFDRIFPPVSTQIEKPPLILIFSPRDQILLERTGLLLPNMSNHEKEALESELALLTNQSVFIENLGGLGTYPSIVADNNSDLQTLETIAHEWMHHWLFFKPLGRQYFKNSFSKQLNESVAQLVGKEIGIYAYELVSVCYSNTTNQKTTEKQTSDFKKQYFFETIQKLRVKVDVLLSQGDVGQAEIIMESTAKTLIDNGYKLRKINQAYFAFHGLYGDDPGSNTNISKQLTDIRKEYDNLKSFMTAVGSIKTEKEFSQLYLELRKN